MLIYSGQREIEHFFDDSNPRAHPIIQYLGEIIIQAGNDGAELDLFGLSLSKVTEWCNEAARNCPTKTGVIHIPNISTYIDRIPTEYRWWIADDIGKCPICVSKSDHAYPCSYGSSSHPGLGIGIH